MRFVVAVVAAFLVAAPPVFAKSGVTAQLETSLPHDAAPGETIRLAWSLGSPDEQGREQPFNASGVFARLLSATGARPTTAFASPGAHPDGRYTAEVVVPGGGIGKVVIGLAGTSCNADGCARSDVLFPVDGSSARPVAMAVHGPRGLAPTWLVLAAGLATLAAGVLATRLVATSRPVRGSSSRPF